MINNLLQWKTIRKNKALYKKYGIKRSVFQSIGAKDFNKKAIEKPWLDRENALASVENHPFYKELSADKKIQVKAFIEEGFMVLKGFYTKNEIDNWNTEIENLRNTGAIDFNYGGRKLMDVHQDSKLINDRYFKNKELLAFLSFVMGKKVAPFQSIHFIEGSEQKAHSDSIHMSTHPEGYLIATWTALEKIDEKNGPVFYYPGSHRLPYVTCEDYESGNSYLKIGGDTYKKYEECIADIIEKNNFEKSYFKAEPGDILVWHANLLHGGSPIEDPKRTRKSMVAHYFCEDVVCYHEITQRPAIVK